MVTSTVGVVCDARIELPGQMELPEGARVLVLDQTTTGLSNLCMDGWECSWL